MKRISKYISLIVMTVTLFLSFIMIPVNATEESQTTLEETSLISETSQTIEEAPLVDAASSTASDLTNQVSINIVDFTNSNGEEVVDGQRVGILSRFNIQYSIDLNGKTPTNGDTISLTFPQPMQSVNGGTVPITNPEGNVVANFVIGAGSSTGTITFNDYYDQTQASITGPIQLKYFIEINRSNIQSETRIPIYLRDGVIFIVIVPPGNTPDAILAKWNGSGFKVIETETGQIYTQWGVRVNRSKSILHNAKLTDTFNGAQKLDLGWGMRLQRYNEDGSQTALRRGNPEFDSMVTFHYNNPNDPEAITGYSIDFSPVMSHMYEVHYRTIITDGGQSREYSNTAEFVADEVQTHSQTIKASNESGSGFIEDQAGATTTAEATTTTETTTVVTTTTTTEEPTTTETTTVESSTTTTEEPSTTETTILESSTTTVEPTTTETTTTESSTTSSEVTSTEGETTTQPSGQKALPETGEGDSMILYIVGLLSIGLGVYMVSKQHKSEE